ncbi:hypothetical protein FW774_16165 [Pedobacter sp. BS3]|uniref:DUF6528 family protein n=1 Tax=Pedobacter sp. BS3 TaxID=2567937 RepID=UPI0011F02198|nr:DUF6528 family protein [Pedobacter sp. BS3]TZF82222.1 hypothetical protein FW774_16165 [Pedobacter sp. BS3]
MRILLFALLTLSALACKKSRSADAPVIITDPVEQPAKVVVFADQSTNRVLMVDIDTKKQIFEWLPGPATNVVAGDAGWFGNISDAKPVLNNQYILATASVGGVALIRIADKKTVFYGKGGTGNVHSAELLPDGNIVFSASTGGYVGIFKVDTAHFSAPVTAYSSTNLADAHSLVWDKKRQVLWAAGGSVLRAYEYNFDKNNPKLTLKKEITLPATGAHDLFPVYDKDALWLSTSKQVWSVDLQTEQFASASSIARVKSVSSGPSSFPVILMQSIDTDQKWWNDHIIDLSGKTIYQQSGLKAYKARWMLPNTFSY